MQATHAIITGPQCVQCPYLRTFLLQKHLSAAVGYIHIGLKRTNKVACKTGHELYVNQNFQVTSMPTCYNSYHLSLSLFTQAYHYLINL